MHRVALVLFLASDRYAAADEIEPMDRLRMQKGIFLLVQNGPSNWNQLFTFEPYDWGPYSRQLASDLRELKACGHLLDDASTPARYGAYRTSLQGEQELINISLADNQAEFIRSVRAFVTTRPFNRLLTEIYAAFPKYAANSKFAGPQ